MLLQAVADLHLRGFQRLRIMPYMGGVGAWRCVLAPASKMSVRDGAWLDSLDDEFTLPRYSGAEEFTYWEWHAKESTPPARLARVFLDTFPDIAEQAFGPDWLYAGWFLHALKLTYPDALPVADGEGGALGMYGREDLVPPPPRGYAGRALPRDVAAQEASAVAASEIHVATWGP
jgi:hypothetical protein